MSTTAGKATRGRGRQRLLTVGGAISAALLIWALAELLFDVDLRAPAMRGSAEPTNISGWAVLLTSGIAGFAALGALALLERFTARARMIWVIGAVIVLLISLPAPFNGSGISTANRLWLLAMHLAVGAVLIVGLYRTASPRRAEAEGEAEGEG
jgi:hypothetical protein